MYGEDPGKTGSSLGYPRSNEKMQGGRWRTDVSYSTFRAILKHNVPSNTNRLWHMESSD